jgi:hypothetical protein
MRFDEGPPRGAPANIMWMKLSPTLKEVYAVRKMVADVGAAEVLKALKELAAHPFDDDPEAR